MSLPPNEDPNNFPSGLIFNPLFFENQTEAITTEQIKKIAITYPVPQDTLIQFPNSIGAPLIQSNGMLSEDGSTAIYSYNPNTDKLTLERDTIVGNLETALELKTNNIQKYSNQDVSIFTDISNNNISIGTGLTTGSLTIGNANIAVSIPDIASSQINTQTFQANSVKTSTLLGGDNETYLSYDTNAETTTITKIETTSIKTDTIERNSQQANVKVFNGSGFGINLYTNTGESFVNNQLKIGKSGSSVLVKADSVDITGTANITTLSNMPVISAPQTSVFGSGTISTKLGSLFNSGFVNITYVENTNLVYYAIQGSVPDGIYILVLYYTTPNSTGFFRILLEGRNSQQTAGQPLSGSGDTILHLSNTSNGGDVTETDTSQSISITAPNNYLYVRAVTGAGRSGSKFMRVTLLRIG